MRKIAKKTTSPAASESGASSAKTGEGNWFRMHWRLIALCLIGVLALVLRFAFSYGISAGDSYALSGGSSASSHHRIIVEILMGTYAPANEIALNYPYGSASISGPMFDYCCAAWAKLFSAFGMTYSTAASASLAWNPPLFAVLTLIPVYLVTRKVFKDSNMALLAALFYAVFPAIVMTTPFSYGTELAFTCFLVAWLVYFVVSIFDDADKAGVTGLKGAFANRRVLMWLLHAMMFMTFIIYSWTGFWAIIMAGSIILLLTLVLERIGNKDMGVTVATGIMVLLVPAVLGAIYYIPNGMWEAIYSGGCMVAVLATVYALIFLALEKKPWVVSIPVVAVIIVAVAAVFAIAMPSLSSAMLGGNSAYSGSLMAALASETSRTSISTMASYYGWLTLWFPLLYSVWMMYKYRQNSKGRVYTFVMLWLFAAFCIGWYNSEYAVIAGMAFAVATAVVIVKVVKGVDVKGYFHSLRGNGAREGAKKALNFFPFVTVLVAVFLVAVPTAVYAVDAATPTNDEHADYYGGLGYTINTSDSSLVNSAWTNTNGAGSSILTWYGYSDAATSVGGYESVTSSVGGGTSAMASALYSSGSSGAIATFIVRLLEDGAAQYTAAMKTITLPSSFDVDKFVSYIDNASDARKYMDDNKEEFIGYNSSVSDDSLPYIVGVQYLQANLGETDIAKLYDLLCNATHNSIDCILVDGSMIPRYYGDGTYASSIAYFGDYALDSSYSTPNKFYDVPYMSTIYYQYSGGYLLYGYTDAMYETFLWNSVLGVTPASSSYSDVMTFLNNYGMSDGTYQATPGLGMSNFTISYWHVYYYADKDSTGVDMDINAALAKQQAEGGYINYLSSVIIYTYDHSKSTEVSGTVSTTNGALEGAKVAVYEKLTESDKGYDPSGKVTYVQRSTTTTGEDGKYTVEVNSSDYLIKVFVGSTTLTDGEAVATMTASDSKDVTIDLVSSIEVVLTSGAETIDVTGDSLVFTGSNGKVVDVEYTNDGDCFTVKNLVPDVYTVTVYNAVDTSIGSVSAKVVSGITAIPVTVDATTLEISVKDMFGNLVSGLVDIDVVDSQGNIVSGSASDGEATVYVVAGTYSVYTTGHYLTTSYTSVTVETGDSEEVTLTVCEANSLSADAGSLVSAIGYTDVASSGTVYVPSWIDGIVGIAGDTVYTGTVSGGTATTVYVVDQEGRAFLATIASDGKFTANMADDSVATFVYATDGSSKAFLGKVSDDNAYTLSDASAVAVTVSYQSMMSGTKYIQYVPVLFSNSDGSVSIYAITNSSGVATVYVPSDFTLSGKVEKAFFGAGLIGDGYLVMTQDFEFTTSSTLSFEGKQGTSSTYYVKGIETSDILFVDEDSLGFNGTLFLDANSGSTYDIYADIVNGRIDKMYSDEDKTTEVASLMPGLYQVSSKTDGYYVTGSQYIYPNTTEVVLDCTECFTLKVTLADSTDKATIITDDGSTLDSDTDDNTTTYTLASGSDYAVKITSSDGKQIWYSADDISADTEITSYELKDLVTFSGNIGAALSGSIYVTTDDGFDHHVTVTDGAYTVDLCKGAVVTGVTVDPEDVPVYGDDTVYKVAGTTFFTGSLAISEDTVRNFAHATSSSWQSSATITGGSMSSGVGTLTVEVTGAYEGDVYYITGSDGFVLDKTYAVELDSSCTWTGTVTGHYSAMAIGAGNSNAAITVTKLGDDDSLTIVIPTDTVTWTGISGKDYIIKFASDDGSEINDTISGTSYKYAISVKNYNTQAYEFDSDTLKAALKDSTLADKWEVVIVDSTGYLVDAETYIAAGLSTTLFYAMVVNTNGDESAEVPEVRITVDAGTTMRSEDVSPATVSLSETSGTVSGGNADNSKVGIPTGFWILTVLSILVLLLLIWGGMKRGVFSRKN